MKFALSAIGFVILTSLPICASAEIITGVMYNKFSQDADSVEIDTGAVAVQLGYRHTLENLGFNLSLFGTAGVGANSENIEILGEKFDYEIDNYYSLSLRPEYKVFDQVTVYALASYGVFESSVSQEEGSLSDSTDEFGYGVGTLINVFGDASLNLSYEKYDDVDSVALGFEYRF